MDAEQHFFTKQGQMLFLWCVEHLHSMHFTDVIPFLMFGVRRPWEGFLQFTATQYDVALLVNPPIIKRVQFNVGYMSVIQLATFIWNLPLGTNIQQWGKTVAIADLDGLEPLPEIDGLLDRWWSSRFK